MKLMILFVIFSSQLTVLGNGNVRGVDAKIKSPLVNKSPVPTDGIKWTDGLSWQQIVKKAKAENKFIFVDCYATWCKPCKLMDRNVYPEDTVGQFMNDKFISIRVQLDTTVSDNKNVKLLYSTARSFEKKYQIKGMPTFLFFLLMEISCIKVWEPKVAANLFN